MDKSCAGLSRCGVRSRECSRARAAGKVAPIATVFPASRPPTTLAVRAERYGDEGAGHWIFPTGL